MIQKIRLHKFLKKLVSDAKLDFTNPEIQKNIKQYGVRINGHLVDNRLEWVTTQDKISIDHWPRREHGNPQLIEVIRENSNYAVLFKPPGLVVQPGAGHMSNNLMSWLAKHLDYTDGNPSDFNYGLVHRIDKDTQGLLLIAKNPASFVNYKDQFKQRSITKKYLAVVEGQMNEVISLQTFQARDKSQPTRLKGFWLETEAHHYDQKYRNALSRFEPLRYCEEANQTLVQIQIFTGRMHQIRLQAEMLHHPLSGDTKYHRVIEDTYPQKKVEKTKADIALMERDEFNSLVDLIFLPSKFQLLSNFLLFEDLDGSTVEVEYRSIESLLA